MQHDIYTKASPSRDETFVPHGGKNKIFEGGLAKQPAVGSQGLIRLIFSTFDRIKSSRAGHAEKDGGREE
jgi:hypothetical protein